MGGCLSDHVHPAVPRVPTRRLMGSSILGVEVHPPKKSPGGRGGGGCRAEP